MFDLNFDLVQMLALIFDSNFDWLQILTQIIESSSPSEVTVFSMAKDDSNFILAFIFILFGMVNHVLVELIRRFIMSKPPGRRMVSLGKVVKATK